MTSSFFHKFILFLLALLVFAGTLFIEARTPREVLVSEGKKVFVLADASHLVELHGAADTETRFETLTSKRELVEGDRIVSSSGQTVVVVFDGHGALRLAPEGELSLVKNNADGAIFRLEKGRVWVSNPSATSELNLVAGGALIIPQKAVFDIEFKGNSEQVRVFENHVLVGLVPLDYVPEKVVYHANGELINSFLVAKGSQAVVYNDKIEKNASALASLLYSKLIKEFQFSLMDPVALATDSWVTENLVLDKAVRTQVLEDTLNSINSRGLRYSSLEGLGYQVDEILAGAANALTFEDVRRRERLVNSIFDHMADAQYFFLYGRITEAKQRIDLFQKMFTAQMQGADEAYSTFLLDRLRNMYTGLSGVLPGEPLFDVKVAVSDALLEHLGNSEDDLVEKMNLVREYLNYASLLADSNVAVARLSFQQYYDRFRDFMEQNRGHLSSVKLLVLQENQIMDNLLRQSPQFYQDAFFAMKAFLESQWLSLLPEGNDKIEERQTIIFTKIDFLKQLQQFFLDEKISLDEARKITLRLITEVKDLQTVGQIGVNQLFALRLKDYGNFLVFLNTTNITQIRGSSAREKYQEFQAQQKEEISVERALNVVLGQEDFQQATLTVDDILEQIVKDLADLGATNVQLGSFTDATRQPLIDIIKAELDGVVFSGKYNWDRKLFTSVRSGGILLSNGGEIRLGALPGLLVPKESAAAGKPPLTDTRQLSKTEKVVLSLLIQKLSANDITASLENIVISDLEDGTFVVNGARITSDTKVQVAFLYKSDGDEVSSMIVRTPKGDEKLQEVITLAEVSTAARQVYNRNK